jgi:two-component system nitrogen regulation response regulator NtrX
VPTDTPPRSPGRTRVLVIDDDEIALQSISDVLEAAGYEVHTMVSPIGATQVIVAKQIEAVVVDLNMPVMRGDRFIALLRGWDRIRELPTVLISGSPMSTLEAIADQLPGTGVVTKENLRTGLPGALARALARRGERSKR